ncbi:serine hydrolase [Aquimarina gracilis]|uniref:Serine hydrolase n=1 Tax=Aquimarina gracilis TaxID=874422 RepID=A0ABU5ZWH4_9FLAO|nr:serine hydrolase [Aquimarina gracilis]MEB3346203.1 serine hydrolase [Aquimarina gracilis]
MRILLALLIVALVACSKESPLDEILNSNSFAIERVMKNLKKHEVQIIYTQIDRDDNGKIKFTDFEFNVNDSVYFYPASSVKLPIALMALEKVNELHEQGINIDRNTIFITQSDTLHTTIEKEIIKIFAVSSNKAYNRLFEFLGQDEINKRLKSKKLVGRISHRLSAFHSHNLKTQSITFKKHIEDSLPLYQQKSVENQQLPKLSLKKQLKGKGHVYNDSLIPQPKDFSEKNYLPLRSLHGIMKRIQFPESFEDFQRFILKPEDRDYVLNAMSALPHEKGYNKKKYYDSYVKFFIYGDTKKSIPEHIKIYNKVGYAYGYLTDCAYVKDSKNEIEFMLSATIHVNNNKIYNDDTYEYDEIGIPFLAELGRKIYDLEKQRKN